MVSQDKLKDALYALQGVLIHARKMAYERLDYNEIANLLDDAEILPFLLYTETDETHKFRSYLKHISEKYKCGYVLQRFDHSDAD